VRIAIVNQSHGASQANVLAMVDAVNAQLVEDYAPAWDRAPATVSDQLYARVQDVPSDCAILLMLPKESVEGAAGHHTETTAGRTTGVVAVDSLLAAGYSLTEGSDSISAVLSHECLETCGDPYVNAWAQMASGELDAIELCDRVQAQSYLKRGISVSNFLLPHAFDAMAPKGAKFDFLGVLRHPFDVAPGGYAVRMVAGHMHQIGGRRAARVHPLGRSSRRLAARHAVDEEATST
jgi:hypothetical protein